MFVPFAFPGGAYGATSTRATEFTNAAHREMRVFSVRLRVSVLKFVKFS
jgi:hypothetical protein